MLKVNDHCNNILGTARKEHYDVLNKFEVGDKVCLKSDPKYKGEIKHINPECNRAYIVWEAEEKPSLADLCNLEKSKLMFKKGDPVRLKSNSRQIGHVTHADTEVCRVYWIDGHTPTIQRNEQLTRVSQEYFSKSLVIETRRRKHETDKTN